MRVLKDSDHAPPPRFASISRKIQIFVKILVFGRFLAYNFFYVHRTTKTMTFLESSRHFQSFSHILSLKIFTISLFMGL